MQDAHEFLRTLTIVLGTAAITTVVFQRLRQPVILGYLVAGMIVGPHVPFPLHADEATTHTLSELGVILLMFSLGLEFSLGKLFRVGPRAAFIGVVQCSLMIWLGYTAGQLFGWTPLESFYTGAILAISSTTIIVKAFQELEIKARFKETVFGILIVEDLLAVLLITVLTTLSSGSSVSARELGITAGRLAAFLTALIVVGMLVVPRLIRFILRLNRPETTLVAAVGICFGSALLASRFGYSVALGAFVAGSLIAESREEQKIEHLIQPVRDMFGAIFFVSVGMLIDPRLIAQHWVAVVVLTALVVTGKIVFVAVSSFLTGAGIRPSVQSGMSLSQIGEFSFIIAGLGLSMKATRDFVYPVAVAVSAATTLLTPWLIRASDPVAAWVDRKLPRPLQTFAALYGSWIESIGSKERAPTTGTRIRGLLRTLLVDAAVVGGIVIGAASSVDRLTLELTIRVGLSPVPAMVAIIAASALLVLPFALTAVRAARRLGYLLATEALPRADPAKLDLAEAPRRALIVTLQLAILIVMGAPLLAATQPFIPPFYGALVLVGVIVLLGVRFWRTATDLQGHVRAATQIIAEALSHQARSGGTGADESARTLDAIRTHLPGLGAPVAIRLAPRSHAVGKSLAELNLRGLTGASVLALTRQGGEVLVPSAMDCLAAEDLLAMAGSEEAIAAAIVLLERGPGLFQEGGPPPSTARPA